MKICRHFSRLALLVSIVFFVGCSGGGGGSGSDSAREGFDEQSGWIERWNRISVNASGLDHTPVEPGEYRVFGEQLGPTRASRAIAIVQIGVFDAVNAILGNKFRNYGPAIQAPEGASIRAAIAVSAHGALVKLFPSQVPIFDAKLAEDLNAIPDGAEKDAGIRVGKEACTAILEMRSNDGSDIREEYAFGQEPGQWRVDPLNPDQGSFGYEWKHVIPFTMASAAQFRSPPPPALDSAEYAAAYSEVKRIGGDGVHTPTERTADQTVAGNFWAYDGTPSLCAPPRLYNQITLHIAKERGSNVLDLARLLALVNTSMADAGVASWETKYYYSFWRPVAAIRESDSGTGPSGKGDGNSLTDGDPTFSPLGAPASNSNWANLTPAFPSYPSGHATFGGALFESLRNFYGTDDIAFTFVSDEYNGTTRADGLIRPLIPRSYRSLSEAEEENGQSRIYLGIHFSFDKTSGITMGRQVADFVNDNYFQPVQ